MSKKLTYIDLFCGAGGLTSGFEKSGFVNVFSLDLDEDSCKTYKKNFPSHCLIQKNILDFSAEEIRNTVKDTQVDVVVGGPPCQGFSIAGSIGRRFLADERNKLLNEFIRVVKIVKPRVFVMENVARLSSHDGGKTRANIVSGFNKAGYRVESKILNSADYGVPQIRKRIVFIGTRDKNLKISFPEKTTKRYVTVKEVLGGLPALRSGGFSNKFFNHEAMNHSDQMLEKMRFVSDGGNRTQIPVKIRPKTGDIRKYIRYKSTSPSVTITGDMRKVFHYSQNRALTVRELARLQSFEDNFVFEGKSISQQQQIGNAVPPLMAEAIARHIKENLFQK